MSQSIQARCPGCQQTTHFTFNGNQHWPPEVAHKLGLPTVIGLWTCAACHTTISEVALRSDDQRPPRIQVSSIAARRLAPCQRAARAPEEPGV
ncbi:MAG: hypothetical protein JXN59_01770 [Anaerolineae bacterium]|nr:hypothetical protein [Anaerolineae bacterium]